MPKKKPAAPKGRKPSKTPPPEQPAEKEDKKLKRLGADVEKFNPEFVEYLRKKGVKC
jgi:hypothetical protein